MKAGTKRIASRSALGFAMLFALFLLWANIDGGADLALSVLALLALWGLLEWKLVPEAVIEAEIPTSNYWVQRADGKILPLRDETPAGISSALRGFDVEGELAKHKANPKKTLPPVIGLGTPRHVHYIRLTANMRGGFDAVYILNGTEKILKPDLPPKALGQLLAWYMAGDEGKVMELLS